MQNHPRFALVLCSAFMLASAPVPAQERSSQQMLDERVEKFLKEHEYSWEDMNIPARDGQFLHDLIVQKGYTRALEIGTSTGHSAIWIAWALSKTGGRLTTIEIDEDRHARALENFREAGVSDLIDARLADAHDLVRELKGPFDFVFSDADKDWYRRYFADLARKMTVGGCFATHNISMRRGELRGSAREYVDFLTSYKNFETTVESTRSTGIAISYRRSQ